VRDGKRRNAEAEMNLLEIGFAVELDGRAGLRRDVLVEATAGLEMTELLFDEFGDSFVRDIARRGDEEMIRREPFPKTIAKNVRGKLFDGFRSAENGAAERMLRPETARKGFMEEIFRIVHVHLDFFEDDLLLVFDVGGIEARTEAEIADDVERDGEMVVENFGVETDLLFGGEGVEHAADGIHFSRDGFGGAALGALKYHVLHEMSKAVLFGGLAARAVAHPHADRNRADVVHGLGHDNQTVG